MKIIRRKYLKTALKSASKTTAYVLSVFIIVIAVFVIIAHVITPYLNRHRADFEKWASELLEMPVKIDQVRVAWYRYQPEISLNQVTLLNKETKKPLLQIQKVSVFFSIPQSLWQHKFVPSGVMISGADVNLYESAAGEISVQGFSSLGGFNNKPYQEETKFSDIIDWLSTQPRLILRDVNVAYTAHASPRKLFTVYNLSLENSGLQHTVLGKAILHQALPTELTLALQWEGAKPDLAQIRAKAYFYISGLSLTQWFKGPVWKEWKITQGITSAKVWATWDKGSFQKVQTTFQAYHLSLYSQANKTIHKINRFSGNIGWMRDGANQRLAGDDILVDLPSSLWPVTSFSLSLQPDSSGALTPKEVKIGYVNLNDVQSFLLASPSWLPQPLYQTLTNLKPKGSLENLGITFSPQEKKWGLHFLQADFNHLSVSQWQHFPGWKNISGAIDWNGSEGEIKLNSSRLSFEYAPLFAKPMNIDQLTGNIKLTRDQNNAWTAQTGSLQMMNEDTSATIKGSLLFPPSATPFANLDANFTLSKANHITRYLPTGSFDIDLVKWLQSAFLTGSVKSGRMQFQGPLADFPFDNGKGVFSISGMVQGVNLRFAPNWPLLKQVNGSLTFTNRKMLVAIDSASISDIPVRNIRGEIANLSEGQSLLEVQADDINTDFSQALKFVYASPLEKKLGRLFANANIKGPLKMKLGLQVPLHDPDKTKVQGELNMSDAAMEINPWHLAFNHLKGKIEFTEDSVKANNLQGEIFNKPIQIDIANVEKPRDTSVIQASFKTNLDLKDLQTWLKVSLEETAEGKADISGKVNFSSAVPIQVHLESDLKGVAIKLPDPFAKAADTTRKLALDMIAQENEPLRMKVNYGGFSSAALIIERKEEKYNLLAANLRLGEGEADWPESSGIYLTGVFDKLDWDKVKNYFDKPENKNFADIKLRRIDVQAKILNVLGLKLSSVRLRITPEANTWGININSPQAVGVLRVPRSFNSRGFMTAQFQKLILSPAASSKKNSIIDVNSLPAMSLVANSVVYNEMPLGKVTLKTSPASAGLNITAFLVQSPRLNLQATGDWTQSRNAYLTHLRGSASSAKVSDLINSLGFNAHNFISSKGKLSFDLNWRDAPYALSSGLLHGSASLDLGPGRIVDIGQESNAKMDLGRMLSIFSLQSIPRRLSLDFSDVFQKGYSFDSIRGDFTFHHGSAFTSNLQFNGPVARVSIDGRIGLKNKDYDFTLVVTPYITSTLPIAATIMGGPVVGLAAFAVNTVVGSKVTSYYYSVTGPWDNPVWESTRVSKGQ